MPQPISTITALDHGPPLLEGTGQTPPWTKLLRFPQPRNSYKVWHHWKKTDELLRQLPFYGEHDVEVSRSRQKAKHVRERRDSVVDAAHQTEDAAQEEVAVVWGAAEGRWLFKFER